MFEINKLSKDTVQRELVITRMFDAPVDIVFRAWSEPERLKHWWAPKGFTLVKSKMDFRPGGTFHYCQSSPDGIEMWGRFVYLEISAPGRLVFINSFSNKEGNITRNPFSPTWPLEINNVLIFEEKEGKTLLTIRGGPINATEDEVKTFEAALDSIRQGFNGTFEQLDEYLESVKKGRVNRQAGSNEFTITRIFNAPRELVWRSWTDPESLKQWWGPKIFTSPHCEMDLRVGGKYLYCMRSQEGQDYWSTGEFHEIVPKEKLVYTDYFSDEKGNVVPASYYKLPGEGWPEELLVTVTFEEQNGGTRMTLRHAGIPGGEMSEMANVGWNESFDKLEESVRQNKGEFSFSDLKIIAEPGKQEIMITRIFDSPRRLVFRTITNPKLTPEWWGPSRLETTVDKFDYKQGGIWRYIQRDSQSNVYAFHGVYHEIVPNERLVYTFEFEGMPGHVLLETSTFEDFNGKTRWTSRLVFQSVEDRDGMLNSGMEEGLTEGMKRLNELLRKEKR